MRGDRGPFKGKIRKKIGFFRDFVSRVFRGFVGYFWHFGRFWRVLDLSGVILDDFGEKNVGDFFGNFWICFVVVRFLRNMEDLGVDFCGEFVFLRIMVFVRPLSFYFQKF